MKMQILMSKRLALMFVMVFIGFSLPGISDGVPEVHIIDPDSPPIYWTDELTNKIQRANLDGTRVEDLVTTGLGTPSGIALDVVGRKMYWTDSGTYKIQRANLDGTHIEDLVTTGLIAPSGIALDVVGRRVYWTDSGTNKIQRANLDGTHIQNVVTTGLGDPVDIALDVVRGKMYWTDEFGNKIQRANLDGTHVENLLTTGWLADPSGIALDVVEGKMYWRVYWLSEEIQRANLDGTHVEDLVITGWLGESSGIALDVVGRKMYWTDEEMNRIQRANLDGTHIQDVVTGLGTPRFIALGIPKAVGGSDAQQPDASEVHRTTPDTDPDVTTDAVGLELPPGLISEVAYGPNSTYFVFNAKFPTLIGVANTDVNYRVCTITLDLPGVPDNSLSEGLVWDLLPYLSPTKDESIVEIAKGFSKKIGLFDVFPDEPQYFIFPLVTATEISKEAEEAAGWQLLKGAGSTLIGLIPGFGALANLGIAVGSARYNRILTVDEILRSRMDPKIVLDAEVLARTLLGRNWGRPDNESRYVLVFPRRITEIGVTFEQVYMLKSDQGNLHTARYEGTYNLRNSAFAAPHGRQMTLLEYPAFRLLPSEVQDYLLWHFPVFANFEALRVPKETSLLPNYPNPFNPETWIPYRLAVPAEVSVAIYAADGRLVRRLNLGHQPMGIYESRSRAAYWDGRNAQGESVASGVYFYTLTAGEFTATRKMLIKK